MNPRAALKLVEAAILQPDDMAHHYWCMFCEEGLNYDDALTPTIFQRATHICRMHKARVRANRRYWNKVDSLTQGEAQ